MLTLPTVSQHTIKAVVELDLLVDHSTKVKMVEEFKSENPNLFNLLIEVVELEAATKKGGVQSLDDLAAGMLFGALVTLKALDRQITANHMLGLD